MPTQVQVSKYHLLYADDVKLIAPRKQPDALQSSLVASSKWSEDWEFIFNPSKSEHFPIGDTSNPATYSSTSRTAPNAQPIQTVSSVRDLGPLLNTGFVTTITLLVLPKLLSNAILPKTILRDPDP